MTAIQERLRSRRVRVNGVTLAVDEVGRGAPILCIHGTGSSAALWGDAALALGTRGRAIAYDRRGFGRSERPEPFTTDVRTQADDAAALLDALGAGPAVVVGRSHGGEIAVDLALRHPDRVRALALLEGGGLALSDGLRDWLAGFHARLFAAAETDVETVGETLIEEVVGAGAWPELPEPVRELFTRNGPAIVAEERGGLLEVTAGDLGRIGCPALVVAGRGSLPFFADWAERASAAVPSATVAWVEGGHLIDPAHPAVLDFVDEVLATGR